MLCFTPILSQVCMHQRLCHASSCQGAPFSSHFPLLVTPPVAAALEAAEAAELNDGTTITVSLEPGLDEIFDEGTRRLQEKSTWKLWQWPPEEKEFFDADSFRYSLPLLSLKAARARDLLRPCSGHSGLCLCWSGGPQSLGTDCARLHVGLFVVPLSLGAPRR